jgi:hypothetical protein
MFAECGMDEPGDAFDAVREFCPIKLDMRDTAASIARKIDELFVHRWKAWEVGHAT